MILGRWKWLLLGAAAAGLAACSGSSGAGTATPGTSPTVSPTASVPPVRAGALNWSSTSRHQLTADLTVGPCPGGGSARLRCVSRAGAVVARFELLRYPTKTIDLLRGVPTTASVQRLHAVAAEAFHGFRVDRRAGCGVGSSFRGPVVEHQDVAGHPGAHWWFALVRHGHVDELVDTWAAVVGRQLVVIRSDGFASHSCLPPEGADFDPRVLTQLRPTLAAAVAGSSL